MTEPRRDYPPPWLFGVVGLPYGVGGAFTGFIMPFLADRAGLKIGTIGWFVTLLFVPPMIQFLYAPLVDVGPKRKHWLILLSVVGAACFAGTYEVPITEHQTGVPAVRVLRPDAHRADRQLQRRPAGADHARCETRRGVGVAQRRQPLGRQALPPRSCSCMLDWEMPDRI